MRNHSLALTVVCWSLVVPALASGQKRDDIKFPSDSDVKLILTQARRAMEQYEVTVQLEEKLLGSKGKEAVDKDKEVLYGLKTMINGLDKYPGRFNSSAGFLFVTTLDDASRNAHVCSASAIAFASTSGMDKDYSSAQSLLALGHSCSDAGILLYTVSESASSLYTKYLENMERMAQAATTVLTQCQEALRQSNSKKN